MPRKSKAVPKYCLHKASGRAVVRIDGRDYYLGLYGTPESHEEYQRRIAEWRENRRPQPLPTQPRRTPGAEHGTLTVVEVLLRYYEFAQTHYDRDGEPSKELVATRDSLKPVGDLYGRTLACEFGPFELKAVRQHRIDRDLCRTEINERVGRIKRCFEWAVSEELVPPSVYQGLQTVTGLQKGRTEAREPKKVEPVANEHVDAILPYVSPVIGAMIRLQRVTGMRPGEVVQVRGCDLERTETVWLYRPSKHKGAWRDCDRVIPLGPQAQAILVPFLDRPHDAYLFSPQESEGWRNEQKANHAGKDRKTPVYPSELRAKEARRLRARKRGRKRPLRSHYDRDSYRRAITYGLQRARAHGVDIPHWHPHQLRHTRATELRRQFGIEAAQVCLGHTRVDTTEIYAERNLLKAIQIAEECG